MVVNILKVCHLGGILGGLFLFEFVSLLPVNFKETGSFNIFQISDYFYKFTVGIVNTINSFFLPADYAANTANIYLSFDNYSSVDSTFSPSIQIQSIGEQLYTNEAIWLLLVSMILLLAMIGPISLTNNSNN